MNYRHAFHAGNHADVLKHVVLLSLLHRLQQKDKPLLLLDTHAGRGRYDLGSNATRKTGEAQEGVYRLYDDDSPPEAVQRYLAAVSTEDGRPARMYPGSSLLMAQQLRPLDRLIATELHSEECAALTRVLSGPRRKAINGDAWQAIKANLPPIERRALVLIDPPYERPDEYRQIEQGIKNGLQRLETGVFALWYPIKNRAPLERLHRRLTGLTSRPILRAELGVWPDCPGNRLNGSGMLIINPPWQLDVELEAALPWLWQRLHKDPASGWRVDWLNPAT